MIEELAVKKDSKIILIDATGEFANFDTASYVDKAIFNNVADSVYYSYKNFVFNDLVALFRPAGQVQLPKLDEAIRSLKISTLNPEGGKIIDDFTHEGKIHYGCEVIDGILKKNNKSQRLFARYCNLKESELSDIGMNIDIKKLISQMGEEFYWLENDIWGPTPYSKDRDNCSSLLLRIGNTLYNPDANKIFNFSQDLDPNNDLIKIIEDFYGSSSKKLLRIDLSSVPEEGKYKEILVNSIGRYFLNNSKNGTYKKKPIILIVDEAHLFLNDRIKDEYSIEVPLNAFDRIAKECRKFGIFLCLSTQRPRDIPEGVLSQIGTFITTLRKPHAF